MIEFLCLDCFHVNPDNLPTNDVNCPSCGGVNIYKESLTGPYLEQNDQIPYQTTNSGDESKKQTNESKSEFVRTSPSIPEKIESTGSLISLPTKGSSIEPESSITVLDGESLGRDVDNRIDVNAEQHPSTTLHQPSNTESAQQNESSRIDEEDGKLDFAGSSDYIPQNSLVRPSRTGSVETGADLLSDVVPKTRGKKNAKRFKCDKCPAACATNYKLKEHYRIHTGERRYKCNHCGYSARRKDILQRHIKRRHQK